jgi:hypothetical protein
VTGAGIYTEVTDTPTEYGYPQVSLSFLHSYYLSVLLLSFLSYISTTYVHYTLSRYFRTRLRVSSIPYLFYLLLINYLVVFTLGLYYTSRYFRTRLRLYSH